MFISKQFELSRLNLRKLSLRCYDVRMFTEVSEKDTIIAQLKEELSKKQLGAILLKSHGRFP